MTRYNRHSITNMENCKKKTQSIHKNKRQQSSQVMKQAHYTMRYIKNLINVN